MADNPIETRIRKAPRPKGAAQAPTVVGIGASVGSAPSLKRLFTHLSDRSDLAYVVVMQGAEAAHQRRLLKDLQAESGLSVRLAKDKDHLAANQIYIAPPGKTLTVGNGSIGLEKAEPAGSRGTIDSFLVSLAQTHKQKAIGVVLAGLGGDGVLGAIELKNAGGLALVEQDGQSGADDPVEGLADFVLPPEAIPERIASHARHIAEHDRVGGQHASDAAGAAEAVDQIPKIAVILGNRTGHDFHGYKPSTFLRRVQRRMNVLQLDRVEDYVLRLRADPAEVDALFQDLLIGVTQFFRDPHEFALIAEQVIPALFAGKGADDKVRVWVLGCATGEEAYSLAILLREHMAGLEAAPQVQIFATDIDARALAQARIGRYPESIRKDVSPDRLERWFVREGATYCVHKDLREMCLFSAHNIVRDAPFSRIDLVSCRNLLIYLNIELQSRVIPLFHFALRPGGYLFLGPSENVTRHAKLFTPINRSHRVFKRMEPVTRVLPEFPLSASVHGGARLPSPARSRPFAPSLGQRAERVAERYAPAYAVVDENYEVLHFSGRIGRYLEPSAGAANLNLVSLVHRDLRLDLRAGLQRARANGRPVKLDNLKFSAEDGARRATLIVEPIRERDDEPPSFVVLFQNGGALGEETARAGEGIPGEEHVQRLESDLRVARERLQASIEELESTNQELKSSNEEYQSINEEMQSANEELETSKEELQSVNEELQTVNSELAHRVTELGKSNSDIKNLLESTQIATLFLDNELCVRSFTPVAAEIFYLVETDLGRPIGHIGNRLAYPDLEDDARTVLRTLALVEREVRSSGDQSVYLVRVLPYRSIDNVVTGVVVTFLDVSDTVRAEQALRVSEARNRLILESSTDYAIIATDREGKVTDWNSGAQNIFGWERQDIVGTPIDAIFTAEDRADGAWAEEMARADAEGRSAGERWHLRDDGTRFWGSGITTPMGEEPSPGYLKVLRDLTEQRKAGERQKLLLAELQHRVRNILAVVRSLAARTADTSKSMEEFRSHFDGRLSTLARTQNILTRTGDVAVEIGELIRDELVAVGAREGETVKIKGPELRLRQPAAESIALAVHELATNALKYGALSQAQGRVSVNWRVLSVRSGKRLSIDWRESGVPIMNLSPPRRGFGRDLIERGLPYDLGASTSLDFLPGGLRAAIEIPLDSSVALLEPHGQEIGAGS